LAALLGGLGVCLGYGRVVEVQLPIMTLASIAGVWLFSVQHRFEHVLWAGDDNWSFTAASLKSASYLHLPRILQWFTGNIGFHHVHHMNPRIPNYRLEECHNASGLLQSVPKLTLGAALRGLRYALWDNDLKRLVPFRMAAIRLRWHIRNMATGTGDFVIEPVPASYGKGQLFPPSQSVPARDQGLTALACRSRQASSKEEGHDECKAFSGCRT
jgi:hypothetical protein